MLFPDANHNVHSGKPATLDQTIERPATGGTCILEKCAEEVLCSAEPVESEDDEITVQEEMVLFEQAQCAWSTARKFMHQRGGKPGVMFTHDRRDNKMHEIRRKKMHQSTILESTGRMGFTPTRNISCAQCKMDFQFQESGMTYVEQEMRLRQCLDEPEKFYKPCPKDGTVAARGCGKITSYIRQPVAKGLFREVTSVQRFCASEGAADEEVQCSYIKTLGGYTEVCICGRDNCNHGNQHSKNIMVCLLTLFITTLYAHY